METVSKLLKFIQFRAINSDDYNFVILDSDSVAEPWEHQKRALESMDDVLRQSTRITQVNEVFYWIGQNGYPTAMWVPKTANAVSPPSTPPPQPLQTPRVVELQNWSDAKLNVVTPFINKNGVWQPYKAKPNKIYAVIPGLNRVSHLMQAQDGANFDLFLQNNWDPSFDHYAYRNPNGKNLRNLSTLVFDEIKDMIKNGNGPTAIVCGSRGGQETVLELTKYWRGLVFDLNGGFLEGCRREFGEIPDGIQIVSVLGQQDFFYFKNRRPRSDSDFKHLVKKYLDFLTRCVGNKKSGQHILYASSIIDHSLNDLEGRQLILSVIQKNDSPIRHEDYVFKVHM